MSYTYAEKKSNKDLVSYQSVRGADVKAVYSNITELPPIKQLHRNFAPPTKETKTDSVDNTVQFLQATDFIDQPKGMDGVIDLIQGQPFEDQAFELQMFHHLMQQTGDQEHFMETHRLLVDQDRQFIDKVEFEEDLEGELDDYSFDWNVDKVEMWYNLIGPLGLVSVCDNQQIHTSPTPRVLYDLLELFDEQEGSIRLREALDWIESNFFYCYADRGGNPRVHAGLSETFATLEYDGAIKLSDTSDTKYAVRIPSVAADTTSSFKLNERPATPAYEYPLDSHDMEVSQ